MSSQVQKYVNKFKNNKYDSIKFEKDTKFINPTKSSEKAKNCRHFLYRIAVYALYDIEKLTPENLSFKNGNKVGQNISNSSGNYVSFSIDEECKKSTTEKDIMVKLYYALDIKLEKDPSSEAKIAKLKKVLVTLKEARKYSAKWIRKGVVKSYLFDMGKTHYWEDCVKAVSNAIKNIDFEKEDLNKSDFKKDIDNEIPTEKIDDDKFCKKFLSNLELYAKNDITNLTPEKLGLKDANKLNDKNTITSNGPENFATALLSKECKKSKSEREVVVELYNALNIKLKDYPSPEAKIAKLEEIIRALKKAEIYSAKWVRKGVFSSYFFGGVGKTKLWDKCIKEVKKAQKGISFKHEALTLQKILDEFFNEIEEVKTHKITKIQSSKNSKNYDPRTFDEAIKQLKNLSAKNLIGNDLTKKIEKAIKNVVFDPNESYSEQLMLATNSTTIDEFVETSIKEFITDYMNRNKGPNQPVVVPEEPYDEQKIENLIADDYIKQNNKAINQPVIAPEKISSEQVKDKSDVKKLIENLFTNRVKKIGEDILKGAIKTEDERLSANLFKNNRISSINFNDFLKFFKIKNLEAEIKKLESKFNESASDNEKNKFLDELMKSATQTNLTIKESLEKYLFDKIKEPRKELIFKEFLARVDKIASDMIHFDNKIKFSDKSLSDWLKNNREQVFISSAKEIFEKNMTLSKNINETIANEELKFHENASADEKNKFFDELMNLATKSKFATIQNFLEEELSFKKRAKEQLISRRKDMAYSDEETSDSEFEFDD